MTRFYSIIFATLFCLPILSPPAEGRDIDLLSKLEGIYWLQNTATAVQGSCALADFIPELTLDLDRKVQSVPRPAIAIVIDDMGINRARAKRAIALPAAVTLAFLPYSAGVRAQAAAAKEQGHELLVHIPMEPERSSVSPGDHYLSTTQTPEEVLHNLEVNLSAFEGYIGANNHMGSKFTRDADRMSVVMQALKKRDMMFLDSKTAPKSVGVAAARAAAVPVTYRDVFLDHYEDAESVAAFLRRTERIARRQGSAVAIGHPKDVTLAALEQWIPTLEAKGFSLVPISTVLEMRSPKPKKHLATMRSTAAVPEAP